MIGLIDYGAGNLKSVQNALNYLGEEYVIGSSPENFKNIEKIILPGVGAFPECINNLKSNNLFQLIDNLVVEDRIPILGICLGMQVMARQSHELKTTKGFGWIDAEIIPLPRGCEGDKTPNIGWEQVIIDKSSKMYRNINMDPDFYFVHTYYMKCNNSGDVTGYYYRNKTKVTASIQNEHIWATQFHPEKSSEMGLQILINFLDQ